MRFFFIFCPQNHDKPISDDQDIPVLPRGHCTRRGQLWEGRGGRGCDGCAGPVPCPPAALALWAQRLLATLGAAAKCNKAPAALSVRSPAWACRAMAGLSSDPPRSTRACAALAAGPAPPVIFFSTKGETLILFLSSKSVNIIAHTGG